MNQKWMDMDKTLDKISLKGLLLSLLAMIYVIVVWTWRKIIFWRY